MMRHSERWIYASKAATLDDVDLTPTEAMRAAAKRGLDLRQKAPKSRKGGLDTKQAGARGIGSGVARARDILSGKALSEKVVRQMHAFFSRHAAFKHKHKEEPEGKAIQSWLLWGGDAGEAWSKRKVDEMNRDSETVEKAARSVKYKHKKFAGYDSKGRKRWRYFYDDPKGGGVKGGKEQEALSASVSVGDVFKSGDGHIKVLMVASDGRITYEDADGQKVNTTEEKLRNKLLSEHKESIMDALESGLMKRQQILDAAKKHGTPKQIERAEKLMAEWSLHLHLRSPSPLVKKPASFSDVAKSRGFTPVDGQSGLYVMGGDAMFGGRMQALYKTEGFHESHPDAYKDVPFSQITHEELRDALASLRVQHANSHEPPDNKRFANLQAEADLGYKRPRAEKALLQAISLYTNGHTFETMLQLQKDPQSFDRKKFNEDHKKKGVIGVGDLRIPPESLGPDDLRESLALVKRLAGTLKTEKRPLYRGIALPEDAATAFLQQMEIGQSVDLRGISSWSSDASTAEDFSRPPGKKNLNSFVFEVETEHGLQLDDLSRHPEEAETVLTGSLRVDRVEQGADGIYRVRCTHVNAE